MSAAQHIPLETDQAHASMPLIDQIRNWWSGPHKTWEAVNRVVSSVHPSVTEVGEIRRARLQAWIAALLAFLFSIGSFASSAVSGSVGASGWVLIALTVVMLVAYGLSRSLYYGWGGWLVTGSVVIAGYGFILSGQGEANSLNSFLPLAFVLGSILLSSWSLFFWVVVGISTIFFIPARFGLDVGTSLGIFIPLSSLLLVAVGFRNNVERSRLAELRSANETLKDFQGKLEQRVAERTKALETSAEVSRYLTSILDPHELASAVVNQVQTAFDYYHAQIYLFDDAGKNLVLTAGTGEAGAAMLKRGHSLAKGRGLVGRAAENNEPVLVSDTSQDPDWLPNELLPDTKAEAAIPIAIGDQVLGVLDVQDDVVNDITSEDITLLESLASQVAISLLNARQYLESMQFKLGIENSGDAVFATDINGTIIYANPAFEKVYGYTPAEVLGKNPRIIKSGFLSSENYQAFWGMLLSKKAVTGEIVNKHKDGRLIYIAGTNSAIVNDAGVITGFLAVHHDVTEQKQNQDLVTQRAHQQEAINLITQKIQGATTIEEAMQVAARELGNALGKRQTLVTLEPYALGGNGKTPVNE